MRILDRYVGRYFLSSLAICGATLAIVFIVVDLVANLDDVVESERPFIEAAVVRYAAQLPLVYQRFGSFVTYYGPAETTALIRRALQGQPLDQPAA